MKKWMRVIILMIIILSSTLFELSGLSYDLGSYYIYVIKPLIWIFIGIIVIFFFKNDINPNLKYKKEINFYVIVATLIYLILYFILGCIKGFGHNPYDRTLNGIIINLWTFIPIIIVKEYARFYMINNSGKKRILLWTLLIGLIFTLIDIKFYKFNTYFASGLSTFEFVMQTFIPSLIVNLFLTYISYFAGPKISILYLLLPQLALYTFPILPNLEWDLISILNSIVPFFTYIYINYMINKMDKTLKKKTIKTVDIKGFLFMLAAVILMLCFGLGLFSVTPLVIASNSMAPKIHKGDLVIVDEKNIKEIKRGDIIKYQLDDYYVVHRVTDIKENYNGDIEYITKGDNNIDIDLYPVKSYQVKGIVKCNIPLVGYPTILLSKMLNNDIDREIKVDKGRQ